MTFLRVRKKDGSIESFDKDKIIQSIRKETGCVGKTIEEIVDEVYNILKVLKIDPITGPLIREFVNTKFLERGMDECRNKYARVGMPVFEARKIDVGSGKGDNANLQNSPETGHKRKADALSKEQFLLMFPDYIAEAHLNGDIHIHDLEYFGTRQFCLDSDLRYFFYYGFVGDGTGEHTSFAAPANRPEVAILHAVKVLGSSQTNCSVCGESLVPMVDGSRLIQKRISKVIDPLFDTASPSEIKSYSGVKDSEVMDVEDKGLFTFAFNPLSKKIEKKRINQIIRHPCYDEIFTIVTSSGRSIRLTSSHSIFVVRDGEIVEISVSDIKATDVCLIPKSIPQGDCVDIIDLYKILSEKSKYKIFEKDDMIYIERSKFRIPRYLKLNEDLWRLVGYYTAEGHITEFDDGNTVNKHVCFSFGVPCDNEEIGDCINLLKSIFHVSPRVVKRHPTNDQVIITSTLLVEVFKHVLKVGKYSHEKRISSLLFNQNEDNIMSFFKGYFCDGHSRRREISFKTVSIRLAYDLVLLLSRLDIVGRIEKMVSPEHMFGDRMISSSTGYRVIFYGKESLKKFNFVCPFEKFEYSVEKPNENFKRYSYFREGDLIGDPVKSIERNPSNGEMVYDFAIDGYENFIANGLCVHNSGGQGFYNFLTFLAPFFEGRDYEVYKQCMQMFVYEMTQMLVARGGQVVFSSVQLSPGIPELWKDIPVVYKGKVWDGKTASLRTYGEFEIENRLLFKALMEVMLEGDYTGKPFYFPKPEISIEPQFIETMEYEQYNIPENMPSIYSLYLLSFELASKFGTPYFDNQIPQYRGAGKGISCFQCCAYCFSSNEDTDVSFDDKLHFRDGAHFSMGSYQVMTVNFPRLAYEALHGPETCNIDEYFEELAIEKIDLCCDVFKLKKKMLKDVSAPFLQQRHGSSQLVDFDALVYTIGVVGINEVCEILWGKQLHEDRGVQIKAMKFIMKMKKYCQKKSQELGITIAFARTPAETTAQRFAVFDLLNYGNAHRHVKGDVKGAIKKYAETGSRDLPIYYTNGTHVPVDANIPMAEKIRIEQAFFPILDGGNICNIYLGETRPDPRGLMDMTLKICKSTNLGYFAFTKDFTVCSEGYRVYTGE